MLTQIEGPLLSQEVNDNAGVVGHDHHNVQQSCIHRTRHRRGESHWCGLP